MTEEQSNILRPKFMRRRLKVIREQQLVVGRWVQRLNRGLELLGGWPDGQPGAQERQKRRLRGLLTPREERELEQIQDHLNYYERTHEAMGRKLSGIANRTKTFRAMLQQLGKNQSSRSATR